LFIAATFVLTIFCFLVVAAEVVITCYVIGQKDYYEDDFSTVCLKRSPQSPGRRMFMIFGLLHFNYLSLF